MKRPEVQGHYHLSTGAEQTQDLSTKHLKVCVHRSATGTEMDTHSFQMLSG